MTGKKHSSVTHSDTECVAPIKLLLLDDITACSKTLMDGASTKCVCGGAPPSFLYENKGKG